MKDKTNVTLAILFILLIMILSIIPLTVQSVTFENEYGKLEVYPDISRTIIRQKQFFNATSYLPNQELDIAFRFNDSLTYGGVYYWNNTRYNKLDVEHIEYNNKHWYLLNDIYFEQYETKKGYWEYDTPINSSGKWDMFIKRSSDTLQYALENNFFVHLDPWWNSSYLKHKVIDITNGCNGYSLLINVTYDNDMNIDFTDCRFVNSSNNTQLYYFVEEVSNSNYMNVWINISNSVDKIVMYYNNSDVSSFDSYNSGANTFVFFDDFEDDVNDWVEIDDSGNGYVEQENTIVKVGSYSTHLEQTDSTYYMVALPHNNMTNGNYTVEYWLQLRGGTSYVLRYGGTDRIVGIDEMDSVDAWTYYGKFDDNNYYTYNVSTGYVDIGDYSLNTWYRMSYNDFDVNGFTTDFNMDGVLKGDNKPWYRHRLNSNNMMVLRPNSPSMNIYVDMVTTRLYCYPIPTYEIGEEVTLSLCDCLLSSENYTNGTTNIEGDLDYYNLTITVNSSCGVFDWVNVSFLNMSHNVSGGSNGTYYLNYTYSLNCSTFPDIINHTWFINTSCNDTINKSFYWFTMEICSAGGGCDCDDIRDIVQEELENYNALKGDDEVELTFGYGILIIIFMSIFYYFANDRDDVVLYWITAVIGLPAGVYYLGWEIALTSRLIGLGILMFAVYCVFLGLAYALGYGSIGEYIRKKNE